MLSWGLLILILHLCGQASGEYDGEREEERPPTVHLPYIAGVSEQIRRVCRDSNIRAVFKSGPTLRSLLTKVKNPLPREKQANIVYEVPCTCGKVYTGETTRRLRTRLNASKASRTSLP